MSSQFIYFRMFGYVVTILMHSINMVCMTLRLQRDDIVELFKDPAIKAFNDNQARYLTCWTFFLQIVYAGIALCCDWLTLKNAHKEDYKLNVHLRRVRDTLFSAIVWPSTLLVSTMFWGLYNLNRELIFPAVLDKALSTPSNHIIHTAIVPVVLWELVFRPLKEPRSHKSNIAHLAFHMVLYLSVVIYTYNETGDWIYPICKKVWGTVLLPLFLSLIFVTVTVFYFMQWPLSRYIHGDEKMKKIS